MNNLPPMSGYIKQAASATAEEALPNATTQREPSGSHASTSSENENPFLHGFTPLTNPQARPVDKQKNPVKDNPLRFTFRTPPVAGPSTNIADSEQLDHTPGSRISANAPYSTITKGIKEPKAIREDFRRSLAKLTQVQSRLAEENNEHALRDDAIMRDMDEMRRGLKEIQAEGRMSQERLEASIATINDLI